MKRVARISVSPVKGFRLSHPDEIRLGPEGVEENRRFFLVDSDGQRLRSSQTPWPTRIRVEYLADSELLRMHFPDGTNLAVLTNLGQSPDGKFLGRSLEEPLTKLVREVKSWPAPL